MLSKLLNLKVFVILPTASSKIFLLADIVPLIPSFEMIIDPLIPLLIKYACIIFLFFLQQKV